MDEMELLLKHWLLLGLSVLFTYIIVQQIKKIFSEIDDEMWENSYSKEKIIIKPE